MKRFFLSISLITTFIVHLNGQQAVTATGGSATGPGGSASFTSGQVVCQTFTSSDLSVSQGVQQPYEISVISAIDESKIISLDYIIYPNPATDFLILKNNSGKSEEIIFELIGSDGKIFISGEFSGMEYSIPTNDIIAGVYFLKVFQNEHNQNKQELKTFKIIKN